MRFFIACSSWASIPSRGIRSITFVTAVPVSAIVFFMTNPHCTRSSKRRASVPRCESCALGSYRGSTLADQMPAPTGALDADLGPDFPCCITGLALIPYQAKVALERARASPAVEQLGAPVVEVPKLSGERAADLTDGQRLWFLKETHVLWTRKRSERRAGAPPTVTSVQPHRRWRH